MALAQTLGDFCLRAAPLLVELHRSRTYSGRAVELRGRQPQRDQWEEQSHILVVGWKPEMHLMISGLDTFVKKVHTPSP